MSGRKRSLVLEAIELTITAIHQARTRAAEERARLSLEQLATVEQDMNAAREALDAAGQRIEALDACDERADLTVRHQNLSHELSGLRVRVEALRGSTDRARRRLDEVDLLLDSAGRQEQDTRRQLYDEDRRMQQAGLPIEWFRDAEYRKTEEVEELANQAAVELRAARRDFDATGTQVRELADALRSIRTEAKVLEEFTGGEEFDGILERIADRKAFAAIAGRREELAAALAQLPMDYADWCPPEQTGLPAALRELDQALQEAEALAHPGSWDALETTLAASAERLAELPEAIAEAGENRDRQARRSRIAEAIMATLDELQFDVSFDPGSRDEPCRISGQTPRSDGDGDFDIAIPLSGEIEFEVAEARGDGHDCHAAVTALQERLKERFGMSWQVTDWGNAAGFAGDVSSQGEEKADSHSEKQRVKHQQREQN